MLRKFGHRDGKWALLNTNGSPLWRYVEKNGKRCKVSNVATAYYQLQRAMKIPKAKCKPLKSLRKTAASMLETHPEFGRYAQYFLGHAPRSITDRHYVKPSSEQFNRAITWLGEEFDRMAIWLGK